MAICVGVDASTKHDQTAIVATAFDRNSQVVRLVAHRVFQPAPNEPLDFEETIERTLLDLDQRFAIRKVLFDPYQLVSVAQRLLKRQVKVEEFAQSSPNLTMASHLYELIQDQRLVVYPDPTCDVRFPKRLLLRRRAVGALARPRSRIRLILLLL